MNWSERWPNFSQAEVLSPDGLALLSNRGVIPLRFEALDHLQSFRELVGPLKVNHGSLGLRGWRSPREALELYGKPKFSFHIAGVAFDVSSDELTPTELADKAVSFGWTGVGLYGTFVHLDLRDGHTAQWEGQ